MLGKRGAPRRNRHLRDRGDARIDPPSTHHPHIFHSAAVPTTTPPFSAPLSSNKPHHPLHTFTWPDTDRRRPIVVLVASFDNFLHHRMRPPRPDGPPVYTLTLAVPPGTHTFKFLVAGIWSTHPALHPSHPIEQSADGVRHHRLVIAVSTSNHDRLPSSNDAPIGAHPVDPNRLVVFRSASACAVSAQHHAAPASLPDTTRAYPPSLAPRGSSFNAPASVPTIPTPLPAARRSLLHRVGSGWFRRFSNRPDDLNHLDLSPSHSLSRTGAQGDRLAGPLFRPSGISGGTGVSNGASAGHGLSLFHSSSEPAVCRTPADEKENSFAATNATTPRATPMASRSLAATPERGSTSRRTGGLRASGRAAAVKVSRPMKVDEPRDVDEVNRQADNWRQMARHLQDDLHDPSAARQLLEKAIQHREKHGLARTPQNAQVHADLARNLSKADRLGDAEVHLRDALAIYHQLATPAEHIADLMLYVGVVVDRQKRRAEAESLYRKALAMYRQEGLKSNNVEIALSNLALNLRKQNREKEIEDMYREHGRIMKK